MKKIVQNMTRKIKTKAPSTEYQELFEQYHKRRFETAKQEYQTLQKKKSRMKMNTRLAEIRDKFYTDANNLFRASDNGFYQNEFLQFLYKGYEDAKFQYEDGQGLDGFIEEVLPSVRETWEKSIPSLPSSGNEKKLFAIDEKEIIKLFAEYQALVEIARIVQSDLDAKTAQHPSQRQVRKTDKQEWWQKYMPTCPQRTKTDSYTNLSAEQTLLLLRRLRRHKAFVSEDYQSEENLYITMGLLTNYSPKNTRTLNAKEVERKENLIALRKMLQSIVYELDKEIEGKKTK